MSDEPHSPPEPQPPAADPTPPQDSAPPADPPPPPPKEEPLPDLELEIGFRGGDPGDTKFRVVEARESKDLGSDSRSED